MANEGQDPAPSGGSGLRRHCVLVATSPPLPIPKPVPAPPLSPDLAPGGSWWLADAPAVASVFAQPQVGAHFHWHEASALSLPRPSHLSQVTALSPASGQCPVRALTQSACGHTALRHALACLSWGGGHQCHSVTVGLCSNGTAPCAFVRSRLWRLQYGTTLSVFSPRNTPSLRSLYTSVRNRLANQGVASL